MLDLMVPLNKGIRQLNLLLQISFINQKLILKLQQIKKKEWAREMGTREKQCLMQLHLSSIFCYKNIHSNQKIGKTFWLLSNFEV